MTIEEAVAYFENLNRVCLALGLVSQNTTKWLKQGYIPWNQQWELFRLTNGKLQPDLVDPKKVRKELRKQGKV